MPRSSGFATQGARRLGRVVAALARASLIAVGAIAVLVVLDRIFIDDDGGPRSPAG